MLRHADTRKIPPKAPWYEALKEDIRQHGMMSALFVKNDVQEFGIRNTPMRVSGGQNRLFVLRELRWKDAPCVICGTLPDELKDRAIELYTLEEIHKYIRDGQIGRTKRGLKLNSALMPEQGRFPRNPEPFWPEAYDDPTKA
jgi:hypothetical protein